MIPVSTSSDPRERQVGAATLPKMLVLYFVGWWVNVESFLFRFLVAQSSPLQIICFDIEAERLRENDSQKVLIPPACHGRGEGEALDSV